MIVSKNNISKSKNDLTRYSENIQQHKNTLNITEVDKYSFMDEEKGDAISIGTPIASNSNSITSKISQGESKSNFVGSPTSLSKDTNIKREISSISSSSLEASVLISDLNGNEKAILKKDGLNTRPVSLNDSSAEA